MRLSRLLLLAVLAAFSTAKLTAQDSSVLVSDLLKEIQRGVNDASARINRDFHNVPPLDSITLKLQTETDVNGSGGLNLWFVKINGGGDKTTSSTMTVVLKPVIVRSSVAAANLDQTISSVLYGAAKGIHDAQIGQGALPLKVESLAADFAFTVKKNGSAGIQFNLLPIGVNASGGGSATDAQTISVKFANPQPN